MLNLKGSLDNESKDKKTQNDLFHQVSNGRPKHSVKLGELDGCNDKLDAYQVTTRYVLKSFSSSIQCPDVPILHRIASP